MLRYVLATFFVVSVSAYRVIDADYSDGVGDEENVYWPTKYTVKAIRVSLTSNLVEDYTEWRNNESSRIDYNQGAMKCITVTLEDEDDDLAKFEIRPETTDAYLNKIACHGKTGSAKTIKFDSILPDPTKEAYVPSGNETIDGIETVKFVFDEKTLETDLRKTIWAYYQDVANDDSGWVPVRSEVKKYDVKLGSLSRHDVYTFSEFSQDFDDDTVFDPEEYGCGEEMVLLHSDSEKITRELVFIDPDDEDHVHHVFESFKKSFHRKYAHETEHAMRKRIFEENVRMVRTSNRRNVGFKLAINEFSDLTDEEIGNRLGAIPRPEGLAATIPFPYVESDVTDIVDKLPTEYDGRLYGLVAPVKNQETCGSCWTFAATAATEGALAKSNGGSLISLSNQALIDCDYDILNEMGAGGCHGGFDFVAYDYIMKYGLPTEEEYGSYKNREGYCQRENMTKTYTIRGYSQVTSNSKNAMKVALVNHGPLFIYVHVGKEFQHYSSGIFYLNDEQCTQTKPNHAVVIIGYGERDGELFWILRNSWGSSWGIDGYMFIDADGNVCGVNSKPSYPVF